MRDVIAVEEKAGENLERTIERDSKKRVEKSMREKTNELENPEKEEIENEISRVWGKTQEGKNPLD